MAERRSCSTVDRLPQKIRLQVDAFLADRTNSQQSVLIWLEEQGYPISRSALSRYSRRIVELAKVATEAIQRTEGLIQVVQAHPDLDYTKAANLLLMDGLVQKVSSADDEFLEMPLDKAGRLIASLSRNRVYEQRTRQDMKKKTELAFDQLETELMDAICQHPELAEELHNVLGRAREKVVTNVGEQA